MTASTDAPPSGAPTGRELLRFPVGLFAGCAAVLYALVAAARWLPRNPAYVAVDGPGQSTPNPATFRGAGLLEGWYRFDGNWYRLVVEEGYRYFGPDNQASVAFFPAYPTLMAAVSWVVGDPVFAGIVVTFCCGLGVAVLFYRFCVEKLGVEVARTALPVLLLYPYAWYLYGAVYADALFVLCVLGAFLLVEHDHPVWAGLVGAVATAGRPVGAAVLLGLVAVLLERRGVLRLGFLDRARRNPPAAARADGPVVDLRRLRPADVGVLLAIGGLALWCLYLWRTFDDPFLFAKVQGAQGWDQQAGPETWFKSEWFRIVGDLPGNVGDWLDGVVFPGYDAGQRALYAIGTSVQGVFLLGALALSPLVLKRLGWGYAVYVLAVLGIPLLGSKDFQGTGRYVLAAFPVFAVVGASLVRRPVLRAVWLGSSAVLLLVWTSFYARGYYVA